MRAVVPPFPVSGTLSGARGNPYRELGRRPSPTAFFHLPASLPAALHVKSEWSLGLGTASVRSLAGGAARLGYDALALTDVEGLHAQIAFHHA